MAAGAQSYTHVSHPGERLDGVKPDVELVAGVLTNEFGYTRSWIDKDSHDLDLPVDTLRRGLSGWLAAPERADDVCVIYLCGHGDVEQQRHYLLGTDSEPDNLVGTALGVDDISRMWKGRGALLVMIDACHSGWGASELVATAALLDRSAPAGRRPGPGLTVMASAGAKQEADQSRFAPALAALLRDPPAAAREETVSIRDLADAINERFAAAKRADQWVRSAATVGAGSDPFFANRHYREKLPTGVDVATQRSPAARDLILHWGPRARGVEDPADAGWHFTGRATVLDELTGWARNPDGDFRIRAVTGRAGTGKSAVLGRLVVLSDTDFVQTIPEPDRPRQPWPTVDASVLARAKPMPVIVAELAAALNVEATEPDQLIDALAGRGATFVVLDALDEAVEPAAIAARLLVPMAERMIQGGGPVRLVVGCRPELLNHLEPVVERIDLEDETYFSPTDVRDYARSLLDVDASPYQGNAQLAEAAATAIARQAGRSFLVARLVARTLASSRAVLSSRELERSPFPASVGAAIDRDLETRFDLQERTRIRDLLVPLAFGHGSGLPKHLWWRFAQRLSGRGSLGDIAWLLDRAGSYVVEDLDDGRSVFRLWHAAVAQHLKAGMDEREAHSEMVDVIVDLVRPRDGARLWATADPYSRKHLAEHASQAGRMTELLGDPGYLVVADPAYLLPVLSTGSDPDSRRVELVFRRIAHRLGDVTGTSDRAAYLLAAARQIGDTRLAESLEGVVPAPAWRVRWTTVPVDTSRVFGGFKPRPDEHLVAIGSSDRGPVVVAAVARQLRQWHLLTAEPAAPPVELGYSPSALAVSPDGRVAVVASSGSLTRVVIDGPPPAANPISPAAEQSIYGTLTIAKIAGRDVIVAVAITVLYQWDLWSGRLVAGPFRLGGTAAEAVLVLDETPGDGAYLVISRARGEIELRRRADGVLIHAEHDADSKRITDLVRTPAADGRPSFISSGVEGRLRRWRIDGERLVPWPWPGREPQVSQPLYALAGDVAGLLLTGGVDIRLFDIASGEPRGVLQGHEGPVRGVAAWADDDRTLIVSHGVDGTVRRWDIADAVPGAAEPDAMGAFSRGAIISTPDGQAVLGAKGGGRLEIRDLETGERLGERTVRGAWVFGMQVASPAGRQVLVAGFETGVVTVVDLAADEEDEEIVRLNTFDPAPGEQLDDLVVTGGGQPLVITVGAYGRLCWWPLLDPDPTPAWTQRYDGDGATGLAVYGDGGGERLAYLDREGDVRSLLVEDLRRARSGAHIRSTPLFSAGNGELTRLAVDPLTGRVILGGPSRTLEVRGHDGRLETRIQLDSWVNDIVIHGSALIVFTNQGMLRIDGLLNR